MLPEVVIETPLYLANRKTMEEIETIITRQEQIMEMTRVVNIDVKEVQDWRDFNKNATM